MKCIAPCTWCKHLNLAASRRAGWFVCKAYPGGVPRAIATGEELHREAYAGDRGIRFELRDELLKIG